MAGWGQRNLSESRPWVAYTPLGSQLAVFDQTPVYWRGTQQLDGRETAVTRAHPTRDELDAAAGLWSITVDLDDAILRNATLTLWVDTETRRPRQLRHETLWRNDGTVRLNATVRFAAYNEPTPVTRPPFREDAVRPGGC